MSQDQRFTSTRARLQALVEQWRVTAYHGRRDPATQIYSDCAAELAACLAAEGEEEPTIDCPLCGALVRQVASATLSLALWQHVHWACNAEKK